MPEHQPSSEPTLSSQLTSASQLAGASQLTGASSSAKSSRAFSFTISGRGAEPKPRHSSEPRTTAAAPTTAVMPFPVSQLHPPAPTLPKTKRPSFSSHRHDANPAVALKLLTDIQTAVQGWHADLHKTVLSIQAIYLEGPIVEGWLESYAPSDTAAGSNSARSQAEADLAMLRHADAQELMTYVDQLYQSSAAPSEGRATTPLGSPSLTMGVSSLSPQTQYRLCSLDSEGKLQCHPCPPDQLAVVSMAIARHQRLRQLINHKQYLEARLKHAVEALSSVRLDLRITTGDTSDDQDVAAN